MSHIYDLEPATDAEKSAGAPYGGARAVPRVRLARHAEYPFTYEYSIRLNLEEPSLGGLIVVEPGEGAPPWRGDFSFKRGRDKAVYLGPDIFGSQAYGPLVRAELGKAFHGGILEVVQRAVEDDARFDEAHRTALRQGESNSEQ
ncbi:hypothetical protein Rsub_01053 [Raphidocelis subcapitata]|uniref:Uncharacterized protein n=1 Tax=Raphidocelis subcapitata TaxID=307507 RepID=A0A2V0NLN9_9CHLO|nr:hypothetical protein Rsub_01053 [Raphidocelis subcapitata]|eukprot:GBF88341.1 hypothetical protein Rsub_01053 [Raphidocelis subcapitata]